MTAFKMYSILICIKTSNSLYKKNITDPQLSVIINLKGYVLYGTLKKKSV